jgi:hypothetical protein
LPRRGCAGACRTGEGWREAADSQPLPAGRGCKPYPCFPAKPTQARRKLTSSCPVGP